MALDILCICNAKQWQYLAVILDSRTIPCHTSVWYSILAFYLEVNFEIPVFLVYFHQKCKLKEDPLTFGALCILKHLLPRCISLSFISITYLRVYLPSQRNNIALLSEVVWSLAPKTASFGRCCKVFVRWAKFGC